MPVDNLIEKNIVERKNINWKYVVLAVPTLYAFFLMIKVVYEPVVPIIIMDEPTIASTASIAPEVPVDHEAETPQSLPESASNQPLLPSESVETPPSITNLPVDESVVKDASNNNSSKDAANSVANTEVVTVDKNAQELTDIELAKKKAKQKAKKKAEEAIQQSPAVTKQPVESQPQQSIVVQQQDKVRQTEPAVIAADTKKDNAKETTKETAKAPVHGKSPWSIFADSIKQGGETPCTPAQIAMNQCS